MLRIKNKNFILKGLVALLIVAVAVILPQTFARAATINVTPGPSAIQNAIDSASDGDVIQIAAGTYDESLVLTKSLTLVGQGDVIIKSVDGFVDSGGVAKGIDIIGTHDVTLTNLVFDGTNTMTSLGATGPNATGVDINSSPGITLNNITVQNYGKNGISIVAQQNPADPISSNITFNNVTTTNTLWAGIAFYTTSSGSNSANITDVVFTGTTTIDGSAYGIQFGDGASDPAYIVSGPDGAPVNLGTVAFLNNTANISNDLANTPILLSAHSTINGQLVSAGDFPGLLVTIVADAAPIIPGVPNTGLR